LNKATNNDVNLESMINKDEPTAKKRFQICKEDDALMASFKTSDYVARVDEASVDDIDIDHSTITSARGSQKFLVPK